MPKTVSEKCLRCAKLSFEQAIALHGPEGTGCWEGPPCHKRRNYYKNRDRLKINGNDIVFSAKGKPS